MPSKRNSTLHKKFILRGRFFKDRSLLLISERFQAATKIKKSLFNIQWKQWFKDIEPLTEFWGYRDPKSSNQTFENKLIFSVSDHSYSTKGIASTDYVEQLRTTPDDDIPLLMADDFWDNKRHLLEARLKKTFVADHELRHISLTPILHRQDLVDRYESLELRSKHAYHCLEIYREMLTRKIMDKYHEKIYPLNSHGGIPILLILKIGNHTYHFSNSMNREFGLMDCEIIHDTIQGD